MSNNEGSDPEEIFAICGKLDVFLYEPLPHEQLLTCDKLSGSFKINFQFFDSTNLANDDFVGVVSEKRENNENFCTVTDTITSSEVVAVLKPNAIYVPYFWNDAGLIFFKDSTMLFKGILFV